MSAVEIPNAIHAAGTFAPKFGNPGQFRTPIPSSVGFQPFDPASAFPNPKGGFTPSGPGQYVMQLIEPIDLIESVVASSIAAPDTQPCVIQQSVVIPPVTPFNPNSDFVAVVIIDPTTGDYKDVSSYQSMVFRYATGPKSKDELLPPP
jgi:hypothetical protein